MVGLGGGGEGTDHSVSALGLSIGTLTGMLSILTNISINQDLCVNGKSTWKVAAWCKKCGVLCVAWIVAPSASSGAHNSWALNFEVDNWKGYVLHNYTFLRD